MSESISIYKRLRAVQVGLKVPKVQSGRFGKHRNVEDILAAAKLLLHKHELTIVLSSKVVEVNGKNYVEATAAAFDEEGNSVQVNASAWEGEISRGLDAPQVTGAATSYARKYALGGLLMIDDSKDPDSHMDVAEVAPAVTQQNLSLPTRNQVTRLQELFKDLFVDHDSQADFFQDAIGKSRPENRTDFDKAIAYGETILADTVEKDKESEEANDGRK